ncbi:hypothetical protein [Pelagibius sp.]|uniref:hypothetical protein n=1 Tax=Pelagibius sp. TaxID=1931238 RepID=UPI0026130F64|nr:hypothetical protein [Pelagibius sp.]
MFRTLAGLVIAFCLLAVAGAGNGLAQTSAASPLCHSPGGVTVLTWDEDEPGLSDVQQAANAAARRAARQLGRGLGPARICNVPPTLGSPPEQVLVAALAAIAETSEPGALAWFDPAVPGLVHTAALGGSLEPWLGPPLIVLRTVDLEGTAAAQGAEALTEELHQGLLLSHGLTAFMAGDGFRAKQILEAASPKARLAHIWQQAVLRWTRQGVPDLQLEGSVVRRLWSSYATADPSVALFESITPSSPPEEIWIGLLDGFVGAFGQPLDEDRALPVTGPLVMLGRLVHDHEQRRAPHQRRDSAALSEAAAQAFFRGDQGWSRRVNRAVAPDLAVRRGEFALAIHSLVIEWQRLAEQLHLRDQSPFGFLTDDGDATAIACQAPSAQDRRDHLAQAGEAFERAGNGGLRLVTEALDAWLNGSQGPGSLTRDGSAWLTNFPNLFNMRQPIAQPAALNAVRERGRELRLDRPRARSGIEQLWTLDRLLGGEIFDQHEREDVRLILGQFDLRPVGRSRVLYWLLEQNLETFAVDRQFFERYTERLYQFIEPGGSHQAHRSLQEQSADLVLAAAVDDFYGALTHYHKGDLSGAVTALQRSDLAAFWPTLLDIPQPNPGALKDPRDRPLPSVGLEIATLNIAAQIAVLVLTNQADGIAPLVSEIAVLVSEIAAPGIVREGGYALFLRDAVRALIDYALLNEEWIEPSDNRTAESALADGMAAMQRWRTVPASGAGAEADWRGRAASQLIQAALMDVYWLLDGGRDEALIADANASALAAFSDFSRHAPAGRPLFALLAGLQAQLGDIATDNGQPRFLSGARQFAALRRAGIVMRDLVPVDDPAVWLDSNRRWPLILIDIASKVLSSLPSDAASLEDAFGRAFDPGSPAQERLDLIRETALTGRAQGPAALVAAFQLVAPGTLSGEATTSIDEFDVSAFGAALLDALSGPADFVAYASAGPPEPNRTQNEADRSLHDRFVQAVWAASTASRNGAHDAAAAWLERAETLCPPLSVPLRMARAVTAARRSAWDEAAEHTSSYAEGLLGEAVPVPTIRFSWSQSIGHLVVDFSLGFDLDQVYATRPRGEITFGIGASVTPETVTHAGWAMRRSPGENVTAVALHNAFVFEILTAVHRNRPDEFDRVLGKLEALAFGAPGWSLVGEGLSPDARHVIRPWSLEDSHDWPAQLYVVATIAELRGHTAMARRLFDVVDQALRWADPPGAAGGNGDEARSFTKAAVDEHLRCDDLDKPMTDAERQQSLWPAVQALGRLACQRAFEKAGLAPDPSDRTRALTEAHEADPILIPAWVLSLDRLRRDGDEAGLQTLSDIPGALKAAALAEMGSGSPTAPMADLMAAGLSCEAFAIGIEARGGLPVAPEEMQRRCPGGPTQADAAILAGLLADQQRDQPAALGLWRLGFAVGARNGYLPASWHRGEDLIVKAASALIPDWADGRLAAAYLSDLEEAAWRRGHREISFSLAIYRALTEAAFDLPASRSPSLLLDQLGFGPGTRSSDPKVQALIDVSGAGNPESARTIARTYLASIGVRIQP